MNKFVIAIVGAVMSLVVSRSALAAPPAWCKNAAVEAPDLKRLSSKNAEEVIKTFVSAECGSSAEADAHRQEIEEARKAWSQRLGMAEADWADAVAYATTRSDYKIPRSTNVLAAATPIDQYAVIEEASRWDIDAFYAADMFEPNLSELGRFALLHMVCLGNPRSPDSSGMSGDEVAWAICQADIERLDIAKLFAEIRADTAHDGALKMSLRFAAYELPPQIKQHTDAVQQMLKRDDANRKLIEIATGAREAWSAAVGKNTKLLELALAMDSADIAKSRKQLADCGPRTAAALAEAVSTLPAKTFAGMHDDRNNPFTGFGAAAGPVLVQSPAVNLAAIAFVRCSPEESGTAKLLKASLAAGPPLRGPRNAALARLKTANITYDKVDAKLSFPVPRPYGEIYPGSAQVASEGGVVRSVKRKGDTLTVELDKLLETQQDCLKSHSTGRVSRIHEGGRVEYERVCDKSGTVVYDRTWKPFDVSARYAAWLKPGIQFSKIDDDIIAVWPSKTAKAPSMVLGGAVK